MQVVTKLGVDVQVGVREGQEFCGKLVLVGANCVRDVRQVLVKNNKLYDFPFLEFIFGGFKKSCRCMRSN